MGKILTRAWWTMALGGGAAVLFGLLVFIWPRLALGVLVALFGAYALIGGLTEVVAGIEGIEHHQSWFWLLVGGVLSVVAGLITFAWPSITALVLLTIIPIWAILWGLLQIGTAIELRRQMPNEWLLLVGGAISVLFGILVFTRPRTGVLAVLVLIGTYAIVWGIVRISLAFRLRNLQQTLGIR
jgi:uncharacterized membrane protein HdeD (DUF308 family)